MLIEVVKWGNSSAVRLPASVMKEVRVVLGDHVDLRAENGRIVLEPAPKPRYRLEDLLANFDPGSRPTDIDFGPAVGNEVW